MKEVMEKVAEVAPRHYEFLLKTAEEIKESPFKDEILQEMDGLMKKAFQMPAFMRGDAAKAVGMGALGVIGAAGAGIAYSLAGDLYDAAKRGITKSRDYRTMLRENPDLARLPAKTVQKTFSVLHRLNPEFAAEPTIAGAWVKRQATYGEDVLGDTGTLKNLIDARKGLGEARKLPSVPKFDPGEMRRNSERHKMEMRRGQSDLDHRESMGPLEQQSLRNRIDADSEARNINYVRFQRSEEKFPYELEKLKDELHRRKNQGNP